MKRRTFLQSMTLGAAAAGMPVARAAEELPVAYERFTRTVDALHPVPAERLQWLAENPDSKTPAELNAFVPEISEIELNNDIATKQALSKPLRVVAWNIERGRHWEAAAKLIQETPALRDPDVLLISEMDYGMARSGNVHTTRKLAEALGMNYAYGVEFLEMSAGSKEERKRYGTQDDLGFHGNAVLAKAPLKNVRMLRFPGIEIWYGSGQHRLGGRNAIVAEVEMEAGPATLVSTHLESGFGDTEYRVQEVRGIVKELDEHSRGQVQIVGGDLNAFPKSSVLDVFREAGFCVDECNDLAEATTQRKHNGEIVRKGFHIDYITLRNAEPVQNEHSPRVVTGVWEGKLLSDHAVVALEVQN